MIDFEELKRIFVMWFKFLVVIAATYFITSLMWIERNSDNLKVEKDKHIHETDSLKKQIAELEECLFVKKIVDQK
jgi:hypothetical protein